MFPFWPDVVAPLIEAAGATRIVEVGALRGENTELMLERLGPDVELHVIDPVPAFDPAEHEQRFAGQYVFHRDLSVNVLGHLPPMDVALIDGDHNWYTVHTELGLLAEVARRTDTPYPLTILHDVAWPYGRRDLYYDPSNIPSEHQQPWRRAGIRRNESRLAGGTGGMNSNLANAEHEGGPRNGVMTAVEDFVASYDKPLRLVVLPIFFGLAILVEEERLAAQPALAETLDRIQSPEGKDTLLRLSEEIRLDGIVFDQSLLRQSTDRADALARRYLDCVKQALAGGDAAAPTRAALDHLQARLEETVDGYVVGDVAVIGAGPAESAAFVAAFLAARDPETRPRHRRRLWILGAGQAKQRLRDLDLLDDRVQVLPKPAEGDLAALEVGRLALIHLGPRAGADGVEVVLEHLYPRLQPGGSVVIEDVVDPETRAAVDRFRTDHGVRSMDVTASGAAGWRVPPRGA